MQKTCLISFLVIFTLGVMFAGSTTHLLGCPGVGSRLVADTYEHQSEKLSISSLDLQNPGNENSDSSNEPFASGNGPTHKIHCCSPLDMLDRIERPQFVSSQASHNFFERTYLAKQAPLLEGPFQPPRI